MYFMYFPVRKGKIPVMQLIDLLGFTKNYNLKSKFDQDIFINLNLDDWIQKQVFYFGRYEIEKNETLFWRNLVKKNQFVFDIGANIGYYTLQASVRVGNSGNVFAFEPVTITYNKLIDNIKLNSFSNIVAEKLALSNSKDNIELFVADEKSTGSSSISMHVNFSGIKETAETDTLDNYVENHKITKADLVKIDVEGCEPMVIEGMKNIMLNFKPLVLIEVLDERLNTIGSNKENLYSLFGQRDYEAFEIISDHEVYKIQSPKEGGLIVFKHKESAFPQNITVVSP